MREETIRFVKDLQSAQDLADQGKTQEAETMLRAAAKRFPRGWTVLANEYLDAGDYETAEKLLTQSLGLTDDKEVLACCYSNLGLIASHNRDRDRARELFEKAMGYDANSAAVLNNIGLSHFWDGDTATGMDYYEKALDADPHFVDAEFHLAMAYIKIGQWKEGWRRYESRWRKVPAKLKKLETNKPEWNGQHVKHIMVMGEQGVGDIIMAGRLAKLLAHYCEKQTWIVHRTAAGMMNLIPELRAVETFGEVGEFDAHVPAMSLFHRLGVDPQTVPDKPYMTKPEPADLGPGSHIGIVWRGSSEHNNNAWRSSELKQWAPLLALDNFTFHSLQYDGEEEAKAFPNLRVHPKPESWLETAKRIAAMDMVVSVDTGPAHLAAAMGIPTHILLSPSAEWRWMCDAKESVLYPTASLWRMDKEMDWENLLKTLADHLKDL